MSNLVQREKTYEALRFFVGNTLHAGELKLYKLLYYLDLLHFRRTGLRVTGLAYQAWPLGPVPPELRNDIKDPRSKFREEFEVTGPKRIETSQEIWIDSSEETVESFRSEVRFVPSRFKPRSPFVHKYLTVRELNLVKIISEIFYEATADMMSDISHNKFGPWKKALQRAKLSGLSTPEIDFLEGVVAVGDHKEELPIEELREIVEERIAIGDALK